MNRATAVSVVVAVALAVGADLAVHFLHRKEATPALRGEAVAIQKGCFSCHGPAGRGGVADPGSRNGFIPGWDGPTVATLAANERELREWILDGAPVRLSKIVDVTRRAPLVPMPAYRKRVTHQEFTDLMVYFRAVSNFGVEMPEPVYEGWKTADRLGCFACHGPNGIGGAQNPGSFKGHIPSWSGTEFIELVRDDSELIEWILNGYPKRLRENSAARYFINGQVIGMPAYQKHLSLNEQTELVAYFKWLRKKPGVEVKKDDSHQIMGAIRVPAVTQ
jgi:mono/diheme cytochrome c family protein